MSTVRLTVHIDEKGQGVIKEPLPLSPGDHEVILVIPEPEDEKETLGWMLASSKSLSAIWDNEEDAIYDEYLVRHGGTGSVPES